MVDTATRLPPARHGGPVARSHRVQSVARVDRGEAGRVLRELRAHDFVFTVLDAEQRGPYRALRMQGGGFLTAHRPYPTMWVRLWFADASGAGHQRAFTLVDADAATDTFWLEFAPHEGAAARWAAAAAPGDRIEASLYGSEPPAPDAGVQRHLLVGDLTSLPAINSLLDSFGPAPATVLLASASASAADAEARIRVRAGDAVRWLPRHTLVDAVDAALADTPAHELYAWAALDAATTRAVARQLKDAGVPRASMHALGYWCADDPAAPDADR